MLATGGDWAAAEGELTAAVDDLEASRPGMVSGGLVRLAELRACPGRAEEARAMFERAGGHRLAVLGLGSLALDAGDPTQAADAAERVLRRLPESVVLDRVPALELLVRARLRLADLEAAADACAELERAAAELAGYGDDRGGGVAGDEDGFRARAARPHDPARLQQHWVGESVVELLGDRQRRREPADAVLTGGTTCRITS